MKTMTRGPVAAALWMVVGIGCDDGPAGGALDRGAVDAEALDVDVDAAADLGVDAGPDAAPDAAVGPVVCSTTWAASSAGLTGTCGPASVVIGPVAVVDGAWLRPACEPDGDGLACAVDGHGMRVERDGERFTVTLLPGADVVVEAVGLEGTATLPGARGWLSNGWQSWSMSGAVAIQAAVDEQDLETAIRHIGDREVIRGGLTHSWWHTVTDGRVPLVAGALAADRFKPWLQVTGEDDAFSVRLISGRAGERVAAAAGEAVTGEPWWIALDPDPNRALAAYGDALPRRGGAAAAEAGWNSWYELWDAVDAEAVRANADLAAAALGEAVAGVAPDGPPMRIVVDDGWQVAWGDWRPNEKFPEGLDGLAAELRGRGLTTGVWMAPLLVDADDPLVAEHPDWFVGDDLSFAHLKHGPMRILDPTHPDAAEHLAGVVRTVVGWGYDFLKIDFLFAGTWEGPRHEDVTGMQAYERALAIIREAAGPDTVLLAVGAPPVAGFAHVDAWRIGPDIAVENFGASWFFVPNEARAIATRWPFCHAVLCDGDPPILRDLPANEVEVGLWTAAFAGGAWFLSDDLRDLPAERVPPGSAPGPMTAGLAGRPSMPVEPIPDGLPDRLASALSDHLGMRTTHVVPAVWRLPSGEHVRINWGPEPAMIDGVEVPGRSAVVGEGL